MMKRSLLAMALAGILAAPGAHAACTSLANALSLAAGCAVPETSPGAAAFWMSGTASPPSLQANSNEIYIVQGTGEEWEAENGAWVDTGLSLASTSPTTQHFYTGIQDPAPSLGITGDVYVGSGTIYVKSQGRWEDSGYLMLGLQGNVAPDLPPPPTPGFLSPAVGISNVSTPSTAANDEGSSNVEIFQFNAFDVTAYATGGASAWLASKFSGSSASATNSSFVLVFDSSDELFFDEYLPSGTRANNQIGSTAWPLNTPLDLAIVANNSASAFTSAYSATAIPAGTIQAYVSTNGTTWTAYGTAVASGGTAGMTKLGASGQPLTIGHVQAADNMAFTLASATITDGVTNVLANPDFTTQTASPFTDTAGNTWTQTGGAMTFVSGGSSSSATTMPADLVTTTPSSATAGSTMTISGTYTGTAPTALTYVLDGGNSTAVASPTISSGTFSFSITAPAAGSHTLVVSSTSPAESAASVSFTTTAAPSYAVAVTGISGAVADQNMTVSGSFSTNTGTTPAGLDYSLDGGAFTYFPITTSGATYSGSIASPAAGSHTIIVQYGPTYSASYSFTVAAAP